MTTLRTQLQLARLAHIKTRLRVAMAERKRAAEEADLPVCAGCGKRHAAGPGLARLIHLIGREEDDEPATAVGTGPHLN